MAIISTQLQGSVATDHGYVHGQGTTRLHRDFLTRDWIKISGDNYSRASRVTFAAEKNRVSNRQRSNNKSSPSARQPSHNRTQHGKLWLSTFSPCKIYPIIIFASSFVPVLVTIAGWGVALSVILLYVQVHTHTASVLRPFFG